MPITKSCSSGPPSPSRLCMLRQCTWLSPALCGGGSSDTGERGREKHTGGNKRARVPRRVKGEGGREICVANSETPLPNPATQARRRLAPEHRRHALLTLDPRCAARPPRTLLQPPSPRRWPPGVGQGPRPALICGPGGQPPAPRTDRRRAFCQTVIKGTARRGWLPDPNTELLRLRETFQY